MTLSYDKIYQDVKAIIKTYQSRDPKEILEAMGVHLIAFKSNTKLLGMYKIIEGISFVFYNPYVDESIKNMVFAHELGHHIYHKNQAGEGAIEYELFDIRSDMELEANIFAAHLLLDENKIMEDVKEGYTYNQLASIYCVNVNLMIFKLNEMHRMGMPIREENPSKPTFLKDIDGNDTKNYEAY